jgi:hypothetical protein
MPAGNNNEDARIEANYQEDHGDIRMLCRDMAELRRDYFGNGDGKKGIKVEVIELKRDFENQTKMINEKLKTNNIMTSAILVAIATALVKILFFP